jgi:hypothetical protein
MMGARDWDVGFDVVERRNHELSAQALTSGIYPNLECGEQKVTLA